MVTASWIEISAEFESEPADWSYVAGILSDLGCPSSRIESFPPRIISCVSNIEGHEKKVAEIESEMIKAGAIKISLGEIPETDWIATFRDYFKARPIGNKLAIVPSWDDESHYPSRFEIRLDPGQAFGTGDHPTTRMCLELLETCELEGKTVLDLGCGSGILAIAAKKLGAAKVIGTDIEEMSTQTAITNAIENNAVVEFICGSGFECGLDSKFDVIVSNIISATLIRLTPEVRTHLKIGGQWIVSGIIAANWKDVEAASVQAGFSLETKFEEGDWNAGKFKLTRGSED